MPQFCQYMRHSFTPTAARQHHKEPKYCFWHGMCEECERVSEDIFLTLNNVYPL